MVEEFDTRFYAHNFYTTYSNFQDLILQEAIPDTNSMHQWGVSDVYSWNFTDQAQFKSITAYLGYWTGFSDDSKQLAAAVGLGL